MNNSNQPKVVMQTVYMYGGAQLEWCSYEHYKTHEEAKKDAEASILRQKREGYNVAPIIVIIREDIIKVYDDLTFIREDRHRTVVEKIQTILMNV